MRSWKTTLFGAISAASGLVLALKQGHVAVPDWLSITAGYVLAGGLGALGYVSKDSNVSGTTPGPMGDTAEK